MSVESIAGRLTPHFSRVFYRTEDLVELHLTILRGIHARYQTPFFNALRRYAERPIGIFHALPIARGTRLRLALDPRLRPTSTANLFMAESSYRGRPRFAARADRADQGSAGPGRARFGAQRTFFVTNGTSTANKIVPWRCCGPATSCSSTATATSRTTTASRSPARTPCTWTRIRCSAFAIYGGVPLRVLKQKLLLSGARASCTA